MSPLRAAVVAESSVLGGAEKYLRELYDDDRFTATLFGHQPGWSPRVDLALSPKWSGMRSLLLGRLRLPAERRRLARAMSGREFDVAHLQFKREQIGFTEPLSATVPVVWTEHGVMPDRTRTLIGRRYARAAAAASAIICVSQEVADHVLTLNPNARVEVIENSVDTTRHRVATPDERVEARRAIGVAEDEPLAIWVGRLDENKRPDLAADVGAGWPGTLLIAGEGAMMPRLRAGDGVRLTGHIDTTPLYIAADVLLMTSNGRGEGMPYVLLEASAHGIPAVVSSSVPLLSRLAGEAGGVSVDEADLAAWRAGLDAVVGSHERRRTARDWAEKHDVELWRRRHLDVITSVL